MDKIQNGVPGKTWSWKAVSRTDFPAEYKQLFNTTDECKPFDNGSKILITSSGGAFAYVDRNADRILHYGTGGNPHSADLLPGNRVVIALSVGGDQLAVYDLISLNQSPLFSLPFHSAHGVVWDEKRGLLWALGMEVLSSYKLEAWDSNLPKLVLVESFPLPEKEGHDLYSIPHSSYLSVTTGEHCWLFDRDRKTFSPHPDLWSLVNVKAISQHPVTGRTALVRADEGEWWSESIHFLEPTEVVHIPGGHFYKVRWNI